MQKGRGQLPPGSRRGPAGVKAGAEEDGGGDEEGEGQAKRSRDPPSPLPPAQAPGAAYGHPCPYKGGCRRGNERPPTVRGARPCPRPRPPPAPRMERCVSTGRSARPAHGVDSSGGGGGESKARAQAQAQAWRARPQRGRRLGKPRPAALQAPNGRRGASGTQGARRLAPARARRPSPSPRAAAQLAAKLSPRPPAPEWRPAKLAVAPGQAAARPEGAPCAARAGPWPVRPRWGPRAAGRESPGPPARASSAPPPTPGPAPRTRGKVGLEPARPVPPGRADRSQEVAAKLFWGVQPVSPARQGRMRTG